MSIPNGWNTFFTRGFDDWMESLKIDYEVAKEISGRYQPNLVVYGWGVKQFKSFAKNTTYYM